MDHYKMANEKYLVPTQHQIEKTDVSSCLP